MWPLLVGLVSKAGALFTGINFGSVFTSIGSAFTGLVHNIVTNWKVWLIALMIGGLGLTGWEWQHTTALLVKERGTHAADIASFKKAQADADARAQATKALLLKESKANADQADASYSTLSAKYHASLLRYASTHQGGIGQSNYHQLPTAQGGDGPSTSSELPSSIIISGSDADICSENTARLQAVHDWAVSLPKEATQP